MSLTSEISTVEFEVELQKERSTGFLVFINEILAKTYSFNQELLNPQISKLLDKYQNRFPKPKPRVKFTNLPLNTLQIEVKFQLLHLFK